MSEHIEGQVNWHELCTSDREAAKSFYSGLLGWETADSQMAGDQGVYTMVSNRGKQVAGMYQMEGPKFEGVPPHWMIYFAVAEVDASVARATELGATTTMPPMDIPGVGRIAMLCDPTGGNFAIFQAGDHPGSACSGYEEGSFGWAELASKDAEAAAAFYSELFACQRDATEMPEIGTYRVMRAGEERLAGFIQMTEAWGDVPTHWMAYITVEDVDAMAAKVTSLGGSVCVPPTDIPPGRMTVINDPAGAVFTMITWATSN